MEHPYGEQYGQEGNPRAYMTMRDYRNLPYQWGNQQPVGRNPNPPRSMREYRDQWMSAPVYSVPSTYPPPPQYAPPEPPCYAPTSQSQQPSQPISLVEQAILDLTKLVGDAVVEQKEFSAQLSEKIHTEENSLDQSLDGLNNDFEHDWDTLQYSIKDLVDLQLCPPEEESQEDECLTETILVEQAQLQPQEELKMESVEAPEELQDAPESSVNFWPWTKEEHTSALISEEESPKEECLNGTMVEEPCLQQPQEGLVENSESSDIGVVVCLWEKKDAIPLLLTEEAVEEHKENNLPLPPTDSVYIMPSPAPQSQPKTPTANAQDTKYPLLVAPSDDQVYILPTPAEKSNPAAPALKAKSNPLPAAPPDSVFILPMPAAQPKPQASTTKATPSLLVLQNIRRLVASVHAFATTSKTMATAYIAWHSGWFGCGFGFGTPGPRHF